ncbi:gliding motility protein GldN [Flaviaesturariibacter amylovorans]|uniref:Gliding motility protein GldN n=1 Tax=Flaviaesturariibacter amylovorans TaxID=1084520 RepID=A0ABP8GCU5_9BACT
MKIQILKIGFLFLTLAALCQTADAQRVKKKRNDGGGGNTTTTAGTGAEQGATNVTRPPVNPRAGIPIRVDSTGMAGTEGIGKSMRPTGAFGHITDSINNKRQPLTYEYLRYDDALFAEKVWRELDLREKMNQSFRYAGQEDNGSQMFIDILLKAVQEGKVTPFADDRFITPKTMTEVTEMTQGSADTNEVRDINNPDVVKEYVVTRASFDPKSVNKIRVMEEWVFDRESSRLFCRILGVAPLLSVMDASGKERGTKAMFWVYYPDLRPVLATYDVYNPKNMGASRMTWEELFEARMFSSYIVKSSLDNPGNRNVRQMIKDPILALLEGDNIKERIFNYEQDLWSY